MGKDKRYDITQCALYKCGNKPRLAKLLLLDLASLTRVHDIISYHSFEIDKKGSTERRMITAPDKEVKVIQRRIFELLQRVMRPVWLMSGEKGKSYIDNGKAHINGKYALTIDIRKFYDNCKRDRVYRFFAETLMTSPDVAKLLTDIVTYKGGIPTGCPTSQIIAFYAYSKMFDEIADISVSFGCVFTLFVDDMTFSSVNPFNKDQLCSLVDCTLRKYDHKPKYRKVRYYSKYKSKPVTGTIITPDNTLVAPNSLQDKIFTNFQYIKKHIHSSPTDTEIAEEFIPFKSLQSLQGQIQAAQNIDPSMFTEIGRVVWQKYKEQVG